MSLKATNRCGLPDWLTISIGCITEVQSKYIGTVHVSSHCFAALAIQLRCILSIFLGGGKRHTNHGTLFRYQPDLRREHAWCSYTVCLTMLRTRCPSRGKTIGSLVSINLNMGQSTQLRVVEQVHTGWPPKKRAPTSDARHFLSYRSN